ncbi:MAG: hypothetical protein GAK37_01048 [Pseudomonas sp.]|nr:MAG: hypothetical protein GAK37_01048 [Pseudomonas sp.]
MKPTMALKPLVFALTALMAVAANAAPSLVVSGSNADGQASHGNAVLNLGTQNTSSANNSQNNSQGNSQANIAAGDANQQTNDAAIASGQDTLFVFATNAAAQDNHNNISTQVGTHDNASLNNSSNNSQGSLGVNVAAGNFNQQGNGLAIASANSGSSAAANTTTQSSVDNTYLNTVAVGPGFPLPTLVPVVNNASANNSLNNSQGNLGANISAGVGNQQRNSTAISSVRF